LTAQRNLLGIKILRELFINEENSWTMIETKAIKALLNLLKINPEQLEIFIGLVKLN
jgi:hypothetical protein